MLSAVCVHMEHHFVPEQKEKADKAYKTTRNSSIFPLLLAARLGCLQVIGVKDLGHTSNE